VRKKLLILAALAGFLPEAPASQPVATAKIAEWAASTRGGTADYRLLSHGQVIDIDSVTCPGKITIVDFSSDYCAPCIELAMYLIKASKGHPERYAIRRVDINRPGFDGIDLESPVSRQFHLAGVPYTIIYDNRVKVAEGDAARRWILADVARMNPQPADGADRQAP
jgi:hypothetical protein